jgi:hypothetical protein
LRLADSLLLMANDHQALQIPVQLPLFPQTTCRTACLSIWCTFVFGLKAEILPMAHHEIGDIHVALERLLIDLYSVLDVLGSRTASIGNIITDGVYRRAEILLSIVEKRLEQIPSARTWRNLWERALILVKYRGEVAYFEAIKMPLARLLDGMKILSQFKSESHKESIRQLDWILVNKLIN